MDPIKQFWSLPLADLFLRLQASAAGLEESEAGKRLNLQKRSDKVRQPWKTDVLLFLSQFKSPLVLLLVFAVVLSIILGEYSDSIIIFIVLLITGVLGFVQERNAGRAIQKLRELVHNKAMVKRQGREYEIFIEDVVPGDIVLLNAGDIIPADGRILEENDLHINESALTGESFPVEKFAGESSEEQISKASNAVFKGTSVINGTASILAVNTGKVTELGRIASSLEQSASLTAFEKGIQQFGFLILRITVVFTGLILILNIVFDRSFLESLLFSLALTVGLTPELLPAIITITLAAGARQMAKKKVIVKKLSAIQNLGGIDILCSDKTGTITEGLVSISKATDVEDRESRKTLLYAFLNARCESGFSNPLDEAIRNMKGIEAPPCKKYDEVPYDFIRKRLSVVVGMEDQHIMITKGSFKNILEVCSKAESPQKGVLEIGSLKKELESQYEAYSDEGFRVIAVCYKDVTGDPVINKDDEQEMVFLGLLVFADPLKQEIVGSIGNLLDKGIQLKIITGDNARVARHIARRINLRSDTVLTGSEMNELTTEALQRRVEATDVFAEVLPDQKERILRGLQKGGHSVGYLGDGINDANALRAADVGISINNAVDVAKEAADLVLLDRTIHVITEGVEEGRKTSVNTLKYIMVTTSANFGNMFSMAIASLLLPFLPLLPVQILLNNFLSDLPAIAIASDKVDEELVEAPRKWNMSYIWRFMLIFGLQSSIFDFLTFGLLYYIFHASPEEFRTAWFMESLLTEILILIIVRTQRPFFRSRPSAFLSWITFFTFLSCLALPYLPFAYIFQLYPLPFNLFGYILLIIAVYMVLAELTKRYLIRRI